ncbi:RNA polymerase sigma factor [Luteimonas kalidii]|uniref:RNA polymerase sigma factor n=1 Tax=Luteimonas kalidii TaxID=3042025 RepID=A0ABT6JXD3_9GAMM|nr:RNA polymerase sigma factor [Luteimonas kalidii]MDH5835346.1 RNA polymerase sigma factor [Luteimonas kalidii]
MSNGFQPAWIIAVAQAAESPLDERFEGFLRDEREALLKFLRTRLPTEEDAQDAVQESLIRMIRYRDSEPPEAWKRLLYRIGVNVANDQHRYARSHHAAAHVTVDDALGATSTDEPTHDEHLAQQEELAAAIEIILTLPPRCQEIFLLNRVEGMTYVQVAETCGISLKAVEKHMTRALTALRAQLGKRGPSAS